MFISRAWVMKIPSRDALIWKMQSVDYLICLAHWLKGNQWKLTQTFILAWLDCNGLVGLGLSIQCLSISRCTLLDTMHFMKTMLLLCEGWKVTVESLRRSDSLCGGLQRKTNGQTVRADSVRYHLTSSAGSTHQVTHSIFFHYPQYM